MICQKTQTIDGVTYTLTWSDEQYKIRRDDGETMYEDFTSDPHTYTETDEKIGEVQDYEQAMRILLGVEA